MNAYELADEFKNRDWDEVDCVLWCEKSANMLRQQADRIAELEEQSEPVAWMSPDGKLSTTEGMLFHIPLYTTPQTKPCNGFCGEQECKDNQKNCERARMAKKLLGSGTPQTKPLSDEEIWEVWQEIVNSRHGVTGQIKPFARAIEAKVRGEK